MGYAQQQWNEKEAEMARASIRNFPAIWELVCQQSVAISVSLSYDAAFICNMCKCKVNVVGEVRACAPTEHSLRPLIIHD